VDLYADEGDYMHGGKVTLGLWVLVIYVIGGFIVACSPTTVGTALGVQEDVKLGSTGGTYHLTALSIAGKYQIGPSADQIKNAKPADIDIQVSVKNQPGKLHLAFDAPEGQDPVVIDLIGGESATGKGVGLVTDQRVLLSFDAFKVGAGQVELTVKYSYRQ
jgi:hypothetical protein